MYISIPATSLSNTLWFFSGDTLITLYANAGDSNNYGAELTAKTALTASIDLTANINALEKRIDATNLQSGLSNSGFTWFAKLNTEVRLNSITCQLTGTRQFTLIKLGQTK